MNNIFTRNLEDWEPITLKSMYFGATDSLARGQINH